MSDFIDRQDAIDAIHKEFDEICVWDESGQATANEVENILYEVPSADPERKSGEWIVHDYALGRERYECSECKKRCDLGYDFCPNCGADMRGE